MARRRRRKSQQKENPDLLTDTSVAGDYARWRQAQQIAQTYRGKFAQTKSFDFDDFQWKACEHVEAGTSVLVAAPTGAGKTIVGEFAVYLALHTDRRAFYTTPIKALSNQKYLDFCADYGVENVGLVTGDTVTNPGAPIVVMTTEVLRNRLYNGDEPEDLGYVIMDEVHYLADRFRGPVWEEVILQLGESVCLVSLSATVSNAESFGQWLASVRGGCEVVVSEKRPVPLWQHMMVGTRLFDLYPSHLHPSEITSQTAVNPELEAYVAAVESGQMGRSRRSRGAGGFYRGRPRVVLAPRPKIVMSLAQAKLLPAIYFIFSRAACDDAVYSLWAANTSLTTPEERDLIARKVDLVLAQVPASDYSVLGLDRFRSCVLNGYAAHHAGMLPMMKELIEDLFKSSLLKVVFATETLALGINMPARTVVIESLKKWDGQEHVMLSAGQYTQLTGRAGRRGIDHQGHAVVLARQEATPQQVASLASKRTYPLYSAFKPTYNMVANLLGRHSVPGARAVLEQSFAQFQTDASVVDLSRKITRLRKEAKRGQAAIECDYGDVMQLAAWRSELRELEEKAKRNRQVSKRDAARALFKQLKRGDIVIYQLNSKQHCAIVTAESDVRQAEPEVEVVTLGARRRKLSAFNVPEGIIKVARHRLGPSFDAESATDRKKIQGTLKSASRNNQALSPAHPNAQVLAEIASLQAKINNHPAWACPQLQKHLNKIAKTRKRTAQIQSLEAQMAGAEGSLGRQFDAVRSVLRDLGYLDSDYRVNDWGHMLSKIYSEKDLIVAQMVRHRLFSDLDPAALAALVSSCVYEPRSDISPTTYFEAGSMDQLRLAWHRAQELTREIHQVELKYRRETSAELEPGIMGATFAWCQGASLETVLDLAQLPSGDFVRVIKQIIDLLGHLTLAGTAELAMNAADAVKLLNRGVVAWSAL
ncbi:hypothetical protein BK816_04420 [Boudabousia tangfeifanii]|uniref:DEAD/DEAH box helicase n=1 Tax=Boudabousia tangfeifanii TaxID=1912795 RepID=A0A1D9MK04_9ACTO|nr:DEAD/DEAH box helicase [Boudabousia tangfeifanii]AOZ72634.1 hypothetical protein BK816_04420 [Boudabousia tangfeifanii]